MTRSTNTTIMALSTLISNTNNNADSVTTVAAPVQSSTDTTLVNAMPASILPLPLSAPASPQHYDPVLPSTSADEESHLFGIEKSFWKIQSSAQELLRLARTYQHHRATTASRRNDPLPKEIDMLSMTQLSWGLLHAVSDINNHNQRLLAARHGLAWRRRVLQQQHHVTSSGRVGKGNNVRGRGRSGSVHVKTNKLSGCVDCGAEESPRWRRGPAGGQTLCNVCGLLYAKRMQQVREGRGEEESVR